MKVKPFQGLTGMSGKLGDLVYCTSRETGNVYARRNVYPKLTEINHKLGAILKNVSRIDRSDDYNEDLKIYAYRYRKLRHKRFGNMVNSINILLKLMYSLKGIYPDIDLLTIDRDYIYAHDLPCITIKRAVEADLLQKVTGWESLDHPI